MFLKCNNIKCRSDIQKNAMITFCSHIFCNMCFIKIKKSKTCIACKSFCDSEDFFLKELDKTPCLAGYSPEEIFDAARKAISFWMYQNEQEYIIQRTLKEKMEEDCIKAKNDLKNMRASYTMDLETKEQKIIRLTGNLDRERQNNFELTNIISEKNKEYQKLLMHYEKRQTSLPKIEFGEMENYSDE